MTDTFTHIGDLASTIVKKTGREEINWSGEKIAVNGIYNLVPIERYHNDINLFDAFSISSSGLRQVIRRPSEYWAYSPYNPDRFEKEQKDNLNFGKAAHMLLLGEEGFHASYALRPDIIAGKEWHGNRTACKEWLAEQKEAGKSILTEADLEHIKNIGKSLGKHPIIKQGLLNGRIERSIVYRDKEADFWIKARPDVVPNSSGDFVDLKTANDVSTDGISKAIYSHGYHIQAAVVRMAIREVIGAEAFQSFSFVFVEKTPPYDVRVLQLKDADIDLGERQARKAIQIVKECLKRHEWHGYDGFSPSVDWIEMPSWARTRLETDLNNEERAA